MFLSSDVSFLILIFRRCHRRCDTKGCCTREYRKRDGRWHGNNSSMKIQFVKHGCGNWSACTREEKCNNIYAQSCCRCVEDDGWMFYDGCTSCMRTKGDLNTSSIQAKEWGNLQYSFVYIVGFIYSEFLSVSLWRRVIKSRRY